MSSRHVSVRIDPATFDRLETRSRQLGQTRSQLMNTLLEEGLRMEEHPGIVFRTGPAGRRPGLVHGPDIWEIARLFPGGERDEETVHRVASQMDLLPDQVRTALRYYAHHRDEIDDWIRMVDAEAEQAEAAWIRQQQILQS